MCRKTCFFVGHRDVPPEICPALRAEVERHIRELGVTEFIVGHYGRFDRLAAKTVISARQVHPGISLLLLLPYHPAECPVELPAGFDGIYYPPGMESVPRKFSITRANRYALDHADCLIACVLHPASNTQKLVEYARRRERRGLLSVALLSLEQAPPSCSLPPTVFCGRMDEIFFSEVRRMIVYRENSLSPEAINQIRTAVGWSEFSAAQLERAIRTTAYSISAYQNDYPVGMARLVGDGIYYLLCDVAVVPSFQGKGVGGELVRRSIAHARQALADGERCTIVLVSAGGKEPFYESFGFSSIPNDRAGHGMQLSVTP